MDVGIPCMSPRSFAEPIASACLLDEDDGGGVGRASARVARERTLSRAAPPPSAHMSRGQSERISFAVAKSHSSRVFASRSSAAGVVGPSRSCVGLAEVAWRGPGTRPQALARRRHPPTRARSRRRPRTRTTPATTLRALPRSAACSVHYTRGSVSKAAAAKRTTNVLVASVDARRVLTPRRSES